MTSNRIQTKQMKEGSQFNSILDSKSVMWMRNSTKIEIMGENMEMLEMKNSTNKKKKTHSGKDYL